MRKHKKTLMIISWLSVIICMVLIFVLSDQPASLSSQSSDNCIQWLYNIFSIRVSSHFIRKTAHATEFFGLCLLLNFAVSVTENKFLPIISFLITVLYALTDEFHQLFVEGRACQLKDLLIDSCGAGICLIILSINYLLYKKYCNKRGKLCQF